MIKVLGEKIIRDSNFSVIRLGDKVLKIPLSISASQELSEEKNNLQRVKKDPFFSLYLAKYHYILFFQLMPYLFSLSQNSNWPEIIVDYFTVAFKDWLNWPVERLASLIPLFYFSDFIENHLPSQRQQWDSYLNSVKIPLSSSHGDFCLENILEQDGNLFFIDWVRYNDHSSRFFDLIDFYLFSNKNNNESWMDFWQKEYGKSKKSIMGIEVEPKIFLAMSNHPGEESRLHHVPNKPEPKGGLFFSYTGRPCRNHESVSQAHLL